MHTFIVILLFLIYCPYFGWANIECSMNKNVSYADLHLSDHTMQTMKLPDDRNATELNVFRCMCDSDSAVSLFSFHKCFRYRHYKFALHRCQFRQES